MIKFSEIIKGLRESKGYSQEVLANELNISKSTVAMWETGRRLPSKELYEQIADLFNVDIDYLYGRTTTRKKYHFDDYGSEYINIDTVREDSQHYYVNKETRQMAQEIFENPELRILFDASRKLRKEDIEAVIEITKRLKGNQ